MVRMLAAALCLLLVAPTAAMAAEIEQCTTGLQSGGGSTPAPLTVLNRSGETLSLDWIDQTGAAMSYGQAENGGSLQIESYATHAWRLSAGSRCVCTFVLSAGAQQVSVGPDGKCEAGSQAGTTYERTSSYTQKTVAGFDVRISSRYSASHLKPVLARLEKGLKEVRKLLPPAAFVRLAGITVWLELDDPQFPGGVYHASREWLAANNMNPDKAGDVQFTDNLIEWSKVQPMMFLHEFSHAYHDQVLGYGDAAVLAAYRRAKASGAYESVGYVLGGTQRAYALNNEMEFFAETSEAYFGKNDYFPYTRKDLHHFDPETEAILEAAWHRLD
jgi:dipeptidyl-peptidase-4